MYLLLLLYIFGAVSSYSITIPYGVPPSPTAVHHVLQRLPQWISDKFSIILQEDQEQLKSGRVLITTNADNQPEIIATSSISALYGINYYLRHFCGTQITWDNSSIGTSCSVNRIENNVINLEAPPIRYFGNPCTFSYSFAWWNWQDWERMIDWMALNGFNMALMPIGQEALWRDVFVEMGVPRSTLNSYFTGPAYLAWNRMGNLKGWMGGLSDEFMDSQLKLAKKIITRMNELGIIPVLPTFSGFVPDIMESLYPDQKFIVNSCWSKFNQTYSCTLSASPTSSLFQDIADRFMKKQQEAYGSATHVYSADPLVEIKPSSDLRNLKQLSKAIYTGCAATDSQCIWLLQSWTFSYEKWPTKSVKSFLSGVPIGNLIVLDQHAEQRALWMEYNSFYGHAFIWCLLHNFGGSTEMRGNLRQIDKSYQIALGASNTLVGAGLTMEAINQNYIVYQFMIDRMWRTNIQPINDWLTTYVASRYDGLDEIMLKAWNLIVQSFYSEPSSQEEYPRFSVFLYKRPKFNQRIKYWFDPSLIGTIVNYFSQSKKDLWHHPLFRMDYNDIMREFLQYELGNKVMLQLYEGYGIGDDDLVDSACLDVQKIFKKISQHTNYNMLDYEKSAVSLANSEEERHQFVMNARDLLTTWGPTGENMDYARREWAGLISQYYQPRWAFFCEWILSNAHFNNTKFSRAISDIVEIPFVTT